MTNPLSLEVETEASILDLLRASNKEIEALLASIKVPKIDATTLDRALTLEFTKVVQEMIIKILTLGLTKLRLGIH